MIKVSDLFEVIYGVNLEFQNMEVCKSGIPFVSRTEKNNGVVAFVKKVEVIKPNPKNTISVACGGSVMESFLQTKEYYSGRDLFYLKPKLELTEKQMLYYCMCLRANKYRYSYGRQANKTLANILIPAPEEIPDYIAKIKIKAPSKEPLSNIKIDLNISKWKSFTWKNIVNSVNISKSLDIVNLQEDKNGINYVSRTSENNGILTKVKNVNSCQEYINSANCLTLAMVGNYTSFWQENEFITSQNILILRNPKWNKYNALFISSLIKLDEFRFAYGRTLSKNIFLNSQIKLPTTPQGEPDWEFMENYIKSLPYSSSL